MIKTVHNDEREIQSIWHNAQDGHTVGQDGVTKIETYEENGHMALLTYFAVYKDDFLWSRVNGTMVETVLYKEIANND